MSQSTIAILIFVLVMIVIISEKVHRSEFWMFSQELHILITIPSDF